MTSWPPSMATTSSSGQTVVQVAQPMQYCVSMCGSCDCGPSERSVPFFGRFARANFPLLLFLEVAAHEEQRHDRGDYQAKIIHILFSHAVGCARFGRPVPRAPSISAPPGMAAFL